MVNYQNGKIYKLWSPSKNLVYYGSTTEPLCVRYAKHCYTFRNPDKYGSRDANKIMICGDYKCELVEAYPCNNKQELTLKEAEYIRNNECINKQIPTGLIWDANYKKQYAKLYYDKNGDKLREYQKKYNEQKKQANLSKI